MHGDEEFDSNVNPGYTRTEVNLNAVLDNHDLYRSTDVTLGLWMKCLSLEAKTFLQVYSVQCGHQEVHISIAKYSKYETDPWVPYL